MTNKKKTYFNLGLGIYSNTKKKATPIIFSCGFKLQEIQIIKSNVDWKVIA